MILIRSFLFNLMFFFSTVFLSVFLLPCLLRSDWTRAAGKFWGWYTACLCNAQRSNNTNSALPVRAQPRNNLDVLAMQSILVRLVLQRMSDRHRTPIQHYWEVLTLVTKVALWVLWTEMQVLPQYEQAGLTVRILREL